MTKPVTTRVVVIGHINHDRIWRLTEPLRAGGRIAWASRETRLGGGGYFTARRLLDLGHEVALLSNLMSDAHGEAALAVGRERDRVRRALQQAHPEVTLQRLEPPADGWLGGVHARGRGREAAAFHDAHKSLQQVDAVARSRGFVHASGVWSLCVSQSIRRKAMREKCG